MWFPVIAVKHGKVIQIAFSSDGAGIGIINHAVLFYQYIILIDIPVGKSVHAIVYELLFLSHYTVNAIVQIAIVAKVVVEVNNSRSFDAGWQTFAVETKFGDLPFKCSVAGFLPQCGHPIEIIVTEDLLVLSGDFDAADRLTEQNFNAQM